MYANAQRWVFRAALNDSNESLEVTETGNAFQTVAVVVVIGSMLASLQMSPFLIVVLFGLALAHLNILIPVVCSFYVSFFLIGQHSDLVMFIPERDRRRLLPNHLELPGVSGSDSDDATTPSSGHVEDVLVLSLGVPTECPGMLSEHKVCSAELAALKKFI